MAAIAREETYRTAIDMAVSELDQLSEAMENLVVRKSRLEKASEGLKLLLGAMDTRMDSRPMEEPNAPMPPREMAPQGNFAPNGMMPPGEFSPVMRFPDRAEQPRAE
ncbi:MAG TPA: hypothetical protein VND90_09170 [Terracidiphilus sp.]|nr:hypothetical protein [Terracidiphilus sp.]